MLSPRTPVPRLRAAALLATLLVFAQALLAVEPIPFVGTDNLGRPLPTAAEVGSPKPGKFAGIFYFLWHQASWKLGPFDVSRIFAADPEALRKPDPPLWGPIGYPHYWGEPLFGYYRSDDPWILRKHAQMLADAGVDTLIFDTTNAETYRDTYRKLCEVFTAVRREGNRTPQIAFMVNTKAGATAQRLFDEFYKPGDFADLWFRWEGKPLLICDPQQASPELRAFFTLRRAHWPFEMVNTKNAWHWEAAFPQPYGYTDDPTKPEQVNVSVAQNLRAADGKVTNMSDGNARGRSFHDGKLDTTPGAVNRGLNFAEQWQRANQLDPPFVMVTGWNEWIAGRFSDRNRLVFVDQFNEEFSRDIEPVRGGHADNYYCQLIAGIRRFKGVAPIPPVTPQPITIDGNFDDWKNVAPEYLDTVGDTAHRNFPGIGTAGPYVNDTGRNDIVAAKVSYDDANIYFYVRTKDPLTPSTDPNWMRLLVGEYVFRAEAPGTAKFAVRGNEMEVAVPRATLGITKLPATIDFKWLDNIPWPCSPEQLTTTGDAAPNDRFYYRAILGKK